MNSEYVIETNGTVRECLQRCLDAGCIPLTTDEITQAKKDGKIPSDKWYGTSTIQFNYGKQKDATEQELRDILSGKLSGALFVSYLDNSSYAVGDGLGNSGSFVRRSSLSTENESLEEHDKHCDCCIVTQSSKEVVSVEQCTKLPSDMIEEAYNKEHPFHSSEKEITFWFSRVLSEKCEDQKKIAERISILNYLNQNFKKMPCKMQEEVINELIEDMKAYGDGWENATKEMEDLLRKMK